jgi:hypothetical protein
VYFLNVAIFQGYFLHMNEAGVERLLRLGTVGIKLLCTMYGAHLLNRNRNNRISLRRHHYSTIPVCTVIDCSHVRRTVHTCI